MDGQVEASESVEQYREKRRNYKDFSLEIGRILSGGLASKKIKFHKVESREKSVDSFKKKSQKSNGTGGLKYSNPLEEITDLAGVRVILYTLEDVERAVAFVEENFSIDEKRDVGEERSNKGQFGYQSIHFLVRLSNDRANLIENSRYRGLVCEIQIRTVLQHAWAEIEHDIQYKPNEESESELSKIIARKFLSLAGLLEIADREFQSLQDDQVKYEVQRDLTDQITRDAMHESAKEDRSGVRTIKQPEDTQIENVRSLLMAGKYAAAIRIYDEKIRDQPKSYTLYLGRAKAKFLNRDVSGARQDLDYARTLKPDGKGIDRLQDQIDAGSVVVPPEIQQTPQSNNDTNNGHTALMAGDGVAAFEHYSSAEENGASKPFSSLNKAMACLVAGDYKGARIALEPLKIIPGRPMEVNIRCINAILLLFLEDPKFELALLQLQQALERQRDFSFTISPMSILKKGLDVNNKITGGVEANLKKVFESFPVCASDIDEVPPNAK